MEVLIALLVAMMMVGASAAALMGILRAEEAGLEMQQAALTVQGITCERFLGRGLTGAADLAGETWTIVVEDVEPAHTQTNAWQTWTMLPGLDARLMITLFFHQNDQY